MTSSSKTQHRRNELRMEILQAEQRYEKSLLDLHKAKAALFAFELEVLQEAPLKKWQADLLRRVESGDLTKMSSYSYDTRPRSDSTIVRELKRLSFLHVGDVDKSSCFLVTITEAGKKKLADHDSNPKKKAR